MSHPIYDNDGSGLKTFAYQMWAASDDEEISLQEMNSFKNSSFKFFVYDIYIKSEPTAKREILNKLILAAKVQTSYVFQGIKNNAFMHIHNRKRDQPPTEKENMNTDDTSTSGNSSLKQAFTAMERQRDLACSNTRCLEFVYNYFVDTKYQQRENYSTYQGSI